MFDALPKTSYDANGIHACNPVGYKILTDISQEVCTVLILVTVHLVIYKPLTEETYLSFR